MNINVFELIKNGAKKVISTAKELQVKDWEVMGYSVLGCLILQAFTGPELGSVIIGGLIGLMIQNKIQIKGK